MKWLKQLEYRSWLWVDKKIILARLTRDLEEAKREVTKEILAKLPKLGDNTTSYDGLEGLSDNPLADTIKKGYDDVK